MLCPLLGSPSPLPSPLMAAARAAVASSLSRLFARTQPAKLIPSRRLAAGGGQSLSNLPLFYLLFQIKMLLRLLILLLLLFVMSLPFVFLSDRISLCYTDDLRCP